MKVKAIVCMSEGAFISKKSGELLIHSKKDIKHFIEYTTGTVMVMGRKTIDTLPKKLSRYTVCMSRSIDTHPNADIVVSSVEEVFDIAKAQGKDITICGGSEIYDLFVDHITDVSVTTVFKLPDLISEELVQLGGKFYDWLVPSSSKKVTRFYYTEYEYKSSVFKGDLLVELSIYTKKGVRQ